MLAMGTVLTLGHAKSLYRWAFRNKAGTPATWAQFTKGVHQIIQWQNPGAKWRKAGKNTAGAAWLQIKVQ
jgi:hypothetical protein